MRTALLMIVLPLIACAQPRLGAPPLCAGNQVALLAYTPGNASVPACIPLGEGLKLQDGAIVASPVTPVPPATALKVARFPLSGLGPWPTDKSDKDVTVTLPSSPIAGSAVLVFVVGPLIQPVNAAQAVGGAQLTVTVGNSIYTAAGTSELVVLYWAD